MVNLKIIFIVLFDSLFTGAFIFLRDITVLVFLNFFYQVPFLCRLLLVCKKKYLVAETQSFPYHNAKREHIHSLNTQQDGLPQASIRRSATEFSFSPAPLQREDNTQLELEYDKTFVLDLADGHEWDNIQTAETGCQSVDHG